MRILDLTCIYPNPVVDSEGIWVQALDRTLVRQGHLVTTLVLRPWAPHWLAKRTRAYKHLAVPYRELNDQGVQVIFSNYLHVPRLPQEYRLDWNVRLMAERALGLYRARGLSCDLVHAQGITTGFAAELLSGELQIPFAVTLSDDLRHLEKTENRIARQRVERTLAHASAIFAMGPGLYRQVPRFISNSNLDKVCLAPLGIDLDGLHQILADFPSRPTEFRGRIVSVCNLYRLKGVHENLQAMALLLQRGVRDWHYTVVGDGPFRVELEEMVRRLGLSDHVSFVGAQPHREAIRYIYESDIFCLPSWMEAFGQVYAEAAVCGIAAIGCLENGPEIIIHDGETGLLVPPRDIDALANALEFLLTHPAQAQSMGACASERVKTLTWKSTAKIYTGTFERVLANRPA